MKKIIFIFLLFLSKFSSSQIIEVDLSHYQFFNHPKNLETNDAIKKNQIFYGDAFTTDTKLVFNLDHKVLIVKDNSEFKTYTIREIRRNSGVVEVDVLFPDATLVNYFISTEIHTNKDLIICRWVEKNQIVGWVDKFIKIKKGV